MSVHSKVAPLAHRSSSHTHFSSLIKSADFHANFFNFFFFLRASPYGHVCLASGEQMMGEGQGADDQECVGAEACLCRVLLSLCHPHLTVSHRVSDALRARMQTFRCVGRRRGHVQERQLEEVGCLMGSVLRLAAPTWGDNHSTSMALYTISGRQR